MRSLWHLSRHLTARADDNHAAPRKRSSLTSASLRRSAPVRARVRFLAYHRIKPHVPPLVRAPVNSFEFQPCGRTPQVDDLSLSLGLRHSVAGGESSSFTVRTTRVSNPVRSPHLRASASICVSHAVSTIGVLCDIYAFHRYFTHSACGGTIQAPQFQRQFRRWAPGFHR